MTQAISKDPKAHGVVNVVMGNSSADLDSMVCAILYAYSATLATSELHVPLFNLEREDIELRRDAVTLFQEQKIDYNLVPCVGDICLDSLHSSNQLSLTLVDHNALAPSQNGLEEAVVTIIDHHKDENTCPQAKRTIEPAGSCSTLVLEYLLLTSPHAMTRELAIVVLCTILLDTQNLDSSKKSFLPKDIHMAERLIKQTGADRAHYYDTLLEKRSEIDGLSVRQLLRKDAKRAVVGNQAMYIAGLSGLSLEIFEKVEENVDQRVFEFFNSIADSVLVLMFQFTKDGEFNRQLSLCCWDEALWKFLKTGLEASEYEIKNTCSSWPTKVSAHKNAEEKCTKEIYIASFSQGVLKASRKQIMPLLVALLTEYESKDKAAANLNVHL